MYTQVGTCPHCGSVTMPEADDGTDNRDREDAKAWAELGARCLDKWFSEQEASTEAAE